MVFCAVLQWMLMSAWWQECKKCHWITILQLNRKWAPPRMPSLASMVNHIYVTAVALLINVTKSFIELKLSCIWHRLVCSNMKYILRYAAGTAGVWRIAALNEAGGWKDRTTVEDMDLAVRASLKGWEFLYLSCVKVICKLYIYIYKVVYIHED